MGGLAEAVFVIAIEPTMRVSAVSNVVRVHNHSEFNHGEFSF
jgi:hypothetical protein